MVPSRIHFFIVTIRNHQKTWNEAEKEYTLHFHFMMNGFFSSLSGFRISRKSNMNPEMNTAHIYISWWMASLVYNRNLQKILCEYRRNQTNITFLMYCFISSLSEFRISKKSCVKTEENHSQINISVISFSDFTFQTKLSIQ